ncbi:hypothetical protein AG1IA_05874 [Rhizoctonia solani AG-1 IA]|uniref:Uncharacterized protein n=1 Tax=Thanatephorus cucumeris (strain AG1-IA) TaxID=983506 RepID=L8WTK3_THACA|nr:hypothetical protein AG1IA_05874 [Rhizoctonia solani AG-1 IA]
MASYHRLRSATREKHNYTLLGPQTPSMAAFFFFLLLTRHRSPSLLYTVRTNVVQNSLHRNLHFLGASPGIGYSSAYQNIRTPSVCLLSEGQDAAYGSHDSRT